MLRGGVIVLGDFKEALDKRALHLKVPKGGIIKVNNGRYAKDRILQPLLLIQNNYRGVINMQRDINLVNL